MRFKIIILALFVAEVAMAVTFDEACDLLRADPAIRLPDMTDQQCRQRFRIMGARRYVQESEARAAAVQHRASQQARQIALDAGMPLPFPGPTPTHTPTASSTATSTPTTTPTP